MAHARQHCNAPMQHTQSTRNERQNELLQPNAQRGEATAQRLPQTGFRKALRAVFRMEPRGDGGVASARSQLTSIDSAWATLRRAKSVGWQESSPLGRAGANVVRFVELTWSRPSCAEDLTLYQ